MIELRNVYFDIGNIRFENLSLKVKNGEYFILMGPSGAGKTLLLYLITGIVKPHKGKIFIDEIDVTNKSPEERNIIIVPQTFTLFPHLTVYENIAYGLHIRKVPKKEITKRVLSIARILEIEHLLNRMPDTLSEGEKQRVALARALVIEPKAILLDEPTASLDFKTKVKAIQLLKKLHRELKFTAIHVTHDILEALELGDRIAYMEKGRLIKIIEKRKLLSEFPLLHNLLNVIYNKLTS